MSGKVTKNLRVKREKKLKLTKAINQVAANNDQVKPTSQFQEFTIGTQIVSKFGNFEIVRELAVGRCCEVYIGEELSSKHREAIKVFVRKQHYKGALLRELKFLAKLSPHPHIVTPKGYFEYEGRDVLVHELLSCTVKDIQLLHQNRPTSVWLITTFAKHLMRGLAHMHKNGVVHGDVKPHNIMWSGLEETFKLIDFGVSFSLNENMEHAIQSRAYQAPETIRWNQWLQPPSTYYGTQLPCVGNAYPTKPGAEADVWSAGCIIAELMTGSKKKTEVIDWSAEDSLKDSLLSEPQKGSEKPTMFDLLTLPTTVLRIVSLVRPEMDQEFADEIVETVVEMANSCCEGTICPKEYTFYNPNGSLYLVYEDAQDARSAYEILRRSVVKDFTLAVTFFPKEFYENSNFF
ncbi:Serine/threonine-protein kinase Kist [Armadillidium nasatum]|uniref:Serine/threonine-protein kinase Kist n=1 Tax=Armadillidium nasatum TaxID=96803 RepID=A0A5N5SYI1_9CRUS|nr:Serine/threonine-protein kinase Kist [Armadillidium nasatum]